MRSFKQIASLVRGEDISEEGKKSLGTGWMLKADPKLGKAVKDKIDLTKKRQATYGDKSAGKSIKEDISLDEVMFKKSPYGRTAASQQRAKDLLNPPKESTETKADEKKEVKEAVKQPTGKLKDACWTGYTAVGTKMKNGREVPNCVPVKEDFEQLDEMPGANMDTRAVHSHLKKKGWSLSRTSGGHDVFTHPNAAHHIPVPRHRQLKAPLIKGILKSSQISEETKDVGEYDYEGQMARTQLQTTLRNCEDLLGMINDNDNMPEWVQSKITLAQDYITTVRDYLQSKEELGEEVDPAHKKILDKAKTSTPKSPKGEYDRKVEKYLKKKHGMKEEVEQIDELSKKTLGSYVNKALDSAREMPGSGTNAEASKKSKRFASVSAAAYRTQGLAPRKGTDMFKKYKAESVVAEGSLEEDKYDKMLRDLVKARPDLNKKYAKDVKRSKDIESGKELNKLVKKNPGVLKTHSDAVKRDKKLGMAEGLSEMDKSQTPPGRDGHVSHGTYGSRDKKDPDAGKKQVYGKMERPEKTTKTASDILNKAFNKGVAEAVTYEPSPGARPNNAGHTLVGFSFHSDNTKHANIMKHGETGKYYAAGGSSSHPVKSTTFHDTPEDAVKSKKSYVKEEVGQATNSNENPNKGRFMSAPAKKVMKPSPMVTSEQSASDIGQPQREIPLDTAKTDHSTAMKIAKLAARRQAGIKEDMEADNSLGKNDTLAKQSLSRTAGITKDLALTGKNKENVKNKEKFEPEPELSSQIVKP